MPDRVTPIGPRASHPQQRRTLQHAGWRSRGYLPHLDAPNLIQHIETRTGHPLDRVVHAWKSYTAKEANRHLKRDGAFWAPEYFDRYMRDNAHLAATLPYIEHNPVEAGLCRVVSEWPFSSA
jgi:REP element-mobilizing transposase RayT